MQEFIETKRIVAKYGKLRQRELNFKLSSRKLLSFDDNTIYSNWKLRTAIKLSRNTALVIVMKDIL